MSLRLLSNGTAGDAHCVCLSGNSTSKDGYHYNQWIGTYLAACAFTPAEIIAVICGLINIGFWLVAQSPQIYATYKYKKPDNLSPMFLTFWLLGDITNLLGCILTHQLPLQLYTAIYFCSVDAILCSQWIYYKWIYSGRPSLAEIKPLLQEDDHSENGNIKASAVNYNSIGHTEHVDINGARQTRPNSTPAGDGGNDDANSTLGSARSRQSGLILALFLSLGVSVAFIPGLSDSHNNAVTRYDAHRSGDGRDFGSGRVLLSFLSEEEDANTALNANQFFSSDKGPHLCNNKPNLPQYAITFGYFVAWASGLIYFISRIPQIILNQQRGTVEGVSLTLFICSMTANFFYSLSVLLPGVDLLAAEFWKATFPYLLGSLFVMGESIIIVIQIVYFRYYKRNTAKKGGSSGGGGDGDERTPLIT